MEINIGYITKLLTENDNIKNKIISDFGIQSPEIEPELFKSQLLDALQQTPKRLYRNVDNQEVFKAAVKSLGSNSRPWSSFISKENELRGFLEDYNPSKVVQKVDVQFITNLGKFFPGQTSSNDVNAVLDWARKLAVNENYYENFIIAVAREFKHLYESLLSRELLETELLIFISVLFANPQSTWIGKEYLKKHAIKTNIQDYKFNGMGNILASEFLRNLGWNGFKPDRHIRRLFNFWFSKFEIVDENLISLYCSLLGSKNKQNTDFIKYSLIGHKLSPKDMLYSHVDNLVWALGAYVIKKGKEDDFCNIFLANPVT